MSHRSLFIATCLALPAVAVSGCAQDEAKPTQPAPPSGTPAMPPKAKPISLPMDGEPTPPETSSVPTPKAPAQPKAALPAVRPATAKPTAAPTASAVPDAPVGTPTAQPSHPTSTPYAGGPARPTTPRPTALTARLEGALQSLGPSYTPRTHHHRADGGPKYTNRLVFENSPYLLQHAHNPVDWHPWGDEAFALAKQLDRPVIMSVGYATCHWCHVMERESFEDEAIADFMNQNFVCIKVDREERPDVDSVYMDAVHMLAGRGGWPMTIVMTPDRQPFFAGTYFPPRDGVRGSRRGFLSILKELSGSFRTDRSELVQRAASVSRRIAAQAQARPAAGIPGASVLKTTAERFLKMHDATWGGFGRRPKFPRPVTLDFLMRYYRRSKDPRVLAAVTKTLDRMADGGMYDQVGGGFHRYSVDDRWLVPHFEKMLYDNGQLAVTYLDAWQVTGNARYAAVAADILDYVAKEMVDPSGAFWSATDADSEGEEGKFFVWTLPEMTEVLGPERARIAAAWWGVTERGNFEHANILHTWKGKQAVATSLGITVDALETSIAESRPLLYAHRAKRIPPLTDDKVLTAWNGLMISGFARGGLLLKRPDFLAVATRAAQAILETLREPTDITPRATARRLRRTWRQGGEAKYRAYLEDYAFLVQGLLDLYEATAEARWLTEASSLSTLQLLWYDDRTLGGFYRTAQDAEALLARQKPNYDGAEPSGNSISARNLLRLYEFTGHAPFKDAAERTLKWSADRMTRGGTAVPAMLSALDMALDKPRQVIVVQGSDSPEPLLAEVRKAFLPNRMLVRTTETAIPTLKRLVPTVESKIARNGKTTAYVCEGGICKKPTSDPKLLARQLAEVHPYAQ